MSEYEKKMDEFIEKMAEKYDISEEELRDQAVDIIHTKGHDIQDLIEHEAKMIARRKPDMKKFVYTLEFIAENKEEADEIFHSGQEPYELEVEEKELTDEDLEVLWEYFDDIPVDDDGLLENPFLIWGVGTFREDIWHWFDENHSKGLAYLMNIE